MEAKRIHQVKNSVPLFFYYMHIVPIKCFLLYVWVATTLVEDHGHKTQTKTKGNQYQWWRPFTVSLFQIHDLPAPHAVVAPRLKLIVTRVCSLSANHAVLRAIILPALVALQMSHNDPLPTSCIIQCRCSWLSLPLTMNYSMSVCGNWRWKWSAPIVIVLCRVFFVDWATGYRMHLPCLNWQFFVNMV